MTLIGAFDWLTAHWAPVAAAGALSVGAIIGGVTTDNRLDSLEQTTVVEEMQEDISQIRNTQVCMIVVMSQDGDLSVCVD